MCGIEEYTRKRRKSGAKRTIFAIQYDGTNIHHIDGWVASRHRIRKDETGRKVIFVNTRLGWEKLMPGNFVVGSSYGFTFDIFEEADFLGEYESVKSSDPE